MAPKTETLLKRWRRVQSKKTDSLPPSPPVDDEPQLQTLDALFSALNDAQHSINHLLPLSPAERRFVILVTHHRVPPRLAKRETGIQITDKLVAAIEQEQRVIASTSKITRVKVLEGILDAISLAKRLGEPEIMISGWREIAKICGFYEPERHQYEVSITAQNLYQKLDSLPDEELLRIIDGEFSPVGQIGRGEEPLPS